MKNKLIWYLLIPLRSVLFLVTFLILSVLTGKELIEIASWWSVVASIINIAVLGVLIAASKAEKITYLKLINYEKGSAKLKSIIFISLLMIMVGMGGMYLSGYIIYGQIPYFAPLMIAPIPFVLAVINLVVLPITTTLAEDGIYLGGGINQLNLKGISTLVPAFFYALQHSFIPMIFDGKFMIYRFLSFLPLTIFICFWYSRKRNPIPIMMGHILLNIATAVQILATSAEPGIYTQILKIQGG